MLRTSATAFFVKIMGIALGYLIILVLARYFGSVAVGQYALFVSMLTVLGTISSLGFNNTVLRFVGEYKSKGIESTLSLLYGYIFQYVLPVSLLISFVVILLRYELAEIFFGDVSYYLLVITLSLCIPFFAFNLIHIELIRSYKRILISELFRNVFRPLFVVLGFFLLVTIANVTATFSAVPIYLFGLGLFASALLTFWFIYRYCFNVFKRRESDLAYISRIGVIKVALPLMLASFGSLLLIHTDNLMLGFYGTPSDVGIYSVAFKVAFITNIVLMAVSSVASSRFSESYWGGDFKVLKQDVYRAARLIFFITLPISLVILLFSDVIMGLFGVEFIEGSLSLKLLVAAYLFNSLFGAVALLLGLTGHQSTLSKIVLFIVVINIILNYILIPLYGYDGAALASMVSYILQSLLMVVFVYKKLGILSIVNFKR